MENHRTEKRFSMLEQHWSLFSKKSILTENRVSVKGKASWSRWLMKHIMEECRVGKVRGWVYRQENVNFRHIFSALESWMACVIWIVWAASVGTASDSRWSRFEASYFNEASEKWISSRRSRDLLSAMDLWTCSSSLATEVLSILCVSRNFRWTIHFVIYIIHLCEMQMLEMCSGITIKHEALFALRCFSAFDSLERKVDGETRHEVRLLGRRRNENIKFDQTLHASERECWRICSSNLWGLRVVQAAMFKHDARNTFSSNKTSKLNRKHWRILKLALLTSQLVNLQPYRLSKSQLRNRLDQFSIEVCWAVKKSFQIYERLPRASCDVVESENCATISRESQNSCSI